MLSYRHSFHAGNFADVLKHIVQIEILAHLVKKPTPFDYIDTHSGAGLFNLTDEHAEKLQEYRQGVAKLDKSAWPELEEYFDILARFNPSSELNAYPGSPLIAQHFLRGKDRAWLFELHPTDFSLLQNNTQGSRRIRAKQEDGFKGLLSLLPPVSRRGLILIDPPYEIKTDYQQVVDTVIKAHKKFATGTYAIWYPVVQRQQIEQMEQGLIHSGIRNIQRYEIGLQADSEQKGMTATGMIVINPPWLLKQKMTTLLPKLIATLSDNPHAFFKCDILVDE